jgi:hypothetical protein
VKDSRRGSTYPPRNNKAINELKDNNKKQMEEQPKLENVISCTISLPTVMI